MVGAAVRSLCIRAILRPSDDPLPSWNDGATKQTSSTSLPGWPKRSPDFVDPEERVATFDDDGTLWIEQPMYNQFSSMRLRSELMSTRMEGQGAVQVGARRRHEGRRRHGQERHAGDRRGPADDHGRLRRLGSSNGSKRPSTPAFKVPLSRSGLRPRCLSCSLYFRANDFKTFIVWGAGWVHARLGRKRAMTFRRSGLIGFTGVTPVLKCGTPSPHPHQAADGRAVSSTGRASRTGWRSFHRTAARSSPSASQTANKEMLGVDRRSASGCLFMGLQLHQHRCMPRIRL